MIHYNADRFGFAPLHQLYGSIVPKTVVLAIFPAICACVLRWYLDYSDQYLMDTKFKRESFSRLYSTFFWFLGFVLVFRTTAAYNRYWEGVNQLNLIVTEWYDACAQISSFAVTTDIATMDNEDFDVLDTDGIDKDLIVLLHETEGPHHKRDMVLQWIQQTVLEGQKAGIITTPPPIVSRCFQELNSGMCAAAKMKTIAETPFPFPYAQMISHSLILFSFMTPIFLCNMEIHPAIAFLGTFITVSAPCALNHIAEEIEQPFGDDPNDLSCAQAQDRMNKALLNLIKPVALRCPKITPESITPSKTLQRGSTKKISLAIDSLDVDVPGQHDNVASKEETQWKELLKGANASGGSFGANAGESCIKQAQVSPTCTSVQEEEGDDQQQQQQQVPQPHHQPEQNQGQPEQQYTQPKQQQRMQKQQAAKGMGSEEIIEETKREQQQQVHHADAHFRPQANVEMKGMHAGPVQVAATLGDSPRDRGLVTVGCRGGTGSTRGEDSEQEMIEDELQQRPQQQQQRQPQQRRQQQQQQWRQQYRSQPLLMEDVYVPSYPSNQHVLPHQGAIASSRQQHYQETPEYPSDSSALERPSSAPPGFITMSPGRPAGGQVEGPIPWATNPWSWGPTRHPNLRDQVLVSDAYLAPQPHMVPVLRVRQPMFID